jgi:hypothetical protein
MTRPAARSECRHGLQEGTCGFCSTPPLLDVPRTDLLTADSPTIEARFAGTCPHCGQGYAAGMRIGRVEVLGWVCEDCLT